MARETAIIIFNVVNKGISVDLEIPTDITANELVVALNNAFDLRINMDNIKKCYLKAEHPIALLRGNKTLSDYGIRDGSVINFTE